MASVPLALQSASDSALRRAAGAADFFIPRAGLLTATERALYRSFVILHLVGPLLGSLVLISMLLFGGPSSLMLGIIAICVAMFWLFPFWVLRTGSLEAPAFASTQLLTFISLIGAWQYGGFNSPLAPWFVVAVLLAFLYVSRSIRPCLMLMGVQIGLFGLITYGIAPPADPIAVDWLDKVSLVSVLAATFYTSIISLLYTALRKEGSALAAEARRHAATARQLRDALRQARKANQYKSAFLARISHELRTPLNVVIGYSEMLVEDAALQEKAEREQDLRRITEASRHLLSLVNNVVDLAHIEADDVDIRPQPIDLDDVFDRLSDSVMPLIARNGSRLVLEKNGTLGWMNGDPVKLRQCLLNLLSNAGKFTVDGVITLAATRRRSSLGGSVVFEVRDTGIGIEEAALGGMFRPFRQATPDIARQFGGSGLGLALTKRFCTLMGGSLEVESRPGAGSTFRIILPLGLHDAAEGDFAAAPAATAASPAPTFP